MTDQGQPRKSGANGILKQGMWNYAMGRWAPKNPTGRLAFEMAILIGFFLVLAVIAKLATG